MRGSAVGGWCDARATGCVSPYRPTMPPATCPNCGTSSFDARPVNLLIDGTSVTATRWQCRSCYEEGTDPLPLG